VNTTGFLVVSSLSFTIDSYTMTSKEITLQHMADKVFRNIHINL